MGLSKKKVIVFVVALFATVLIVKYVSAGNINNSGGSFGASMSTSEQIYKAILGTFDSSSYSGDANKSAIEIGKCIIKKMNGNSC
ncbi:MAG: hypothetical protein CEN90_726 [Parcubacteria group bacterium Licking1014_17]|nr:MAG: hypothetical protein CEN90_726 [Parcubacteria group bacterium Licking1014_17]